MLGAGIELLSNPTSVLFFGKLSCVYSERLRDELVQVGFRVQEVWSTGIGEELPLELEKWHGDYILCFRSRYILPQWLIARAEQAAVNIHPGPPEYRGSGCLNWALYDGVADYGVTAHFMNEQVDAGRIIDVVRFGIHEDDSVSTLLRRTHEHSLDLAKDLVQGIANYGHKFLHSRANLASNEKWSGPARRMESVDSLSRVDSSMSRTQIERVIRATHTSEFPTYVEIFGYRFLLNTEH